jgi:hypothetical protein
VSTKPDETAPDDGVVQLGYRRIIVPHLGSLRAAAGAGVMPL